MSRLTTTLYATVLNMVASHTGSLRRTDTVCIQSVHFQDRHPTLESPIQNRCEWKHGHNVALCFSEQWPENIMISQGQDVQDVLLCLQSGVVA